MSITRTSSFLPRQMLFVAIVMGMALGLMPARGMAQGGYYKVKPIYIPYPQPNKKWGMSKAGPTGLSLELVPPNFTMRITGIEKNSPAAATGKLKKGQVIESINGKTVKDIDPRVWLANRITESEATDGQFKLMIKGQGEVVVKLPVMGEFSETWPVDCEKTDKIVRKLADVLATHDKPRWGSVLFLLSTGEEKDLEVVRKWMKDFKGVGHYPWFNGLLGPGVCEYYLRTGDERILPVIKGMAEQLKQQIYNGGWSGRGKASFTYMGGGHMNAAGVHCLTFLLLAKQCGVDVDPHTFNTALTYFYRFAGRGNVAYGDQEPEGGYRDNGKTGGLALAMSAAAQLTPDGEKSIYARARDNSAMKSFYASSWFNRAHTGGGIGEIWHATAMQLMRETKPTQWRSFMDERRWHFELSRRHDGSFGVHDGARYDRSASETGQSWGTFHALIYTAHRKKLRLFGAPPTQWSKTHQLPDRPWGTAADDAFSSLKPAEHAPGQVQDISEETIAKDASAAWMGRLGDADEQTMWIALHHPEYGFRHAAMRKITSRGMTQLVLRALKSDDPRVRGVGVEAISGLFKGRTLSNEQISAEMWELIGKMVSDPNESWWNARAAMKALGRAGAPRIVPHVDRLVHFLKHDDWWLSTAALKPARKIALDDRFYRKVLPAVADLATTMRSWRPSWDVGEFGKQLRGASPQAKQLALKLFGKAYMEYTDTLVEPGGQITPNQTSYLRGRVFALISALPGSKEMLLKLPKRTSRWQASRNDAHLFRFNGRFVANTALMGKWNLVGQVGSIEQFDPKKAKAPRRKPYKAITFQAKGKTDNANRMWSGDTLIDLNTNEALAMKPKRIGGATYLFVEAGGFSESKKPDWKTSLFVLKKTK